MGMVLIGVYAYIQLLDKSTEVDLISYSFAFFTRELVQQPDALIKTLLDHSSPTAMALGADLLAAFIRSQVREVQSGFMLDPEFTDLAEP